MRKRVTQEEIGKIKDLAKQGYNLSRMAVILNRDRGTIRKIVNDNNIKIESLSLKQLNIVRSRIKEGIAFYKIAESVHKDKVVLEKILKDQYNIDLSYDRVYNNKKVWGREKLKKLKELYASDRYTIEDIAKYFKCSKSFVTKQAKILGIKKVPCNNIKNGHIFGNIWDRDLANKILTRVKKEMTEDGAVDLEAISYESHIPLYGIINFLKEKASLYEDDYLDIINLPDIKEYEKDLADQYFSHESMGIKYGCSECQIAKIRRETFGPEWHTIRNNRARKSTAEIRFEKIMDSIFLGYKYQEKIGKWWFDYSLGFHVLVEVQGTYWHAKDKVKDRDERKKSFAEEKGYTVIQVKEEDIRYNQEKVKKQILPIVQQHVQNYFGFPENL